MASQKNHLTNTTDSESEGKALLSRSHDLTRWGRDHGKGEDLSNDKVLGL